MAKEKQSISVDDLLKGELPEKALKGVSFEDGMGILEELVARVERGELPLEDSIKSYERGVALVSHLRSVLDGAEARLKVVNREGKDDQKAE